ncbi:hypothetical protein U8P76_29170 (plasmid) [Rhizobium johnstonii]|nr:hypothetical protein U8P76_29170 [Rhizobium johnstonii]
MGHDIDVLADGQYVAESIARSEDRFQAVLGGVEDIEAFADESGDEEFVSSKCDARGRPVLLPE